MFHLHVVVVEPNGYRREMRVLTREAAMEEVERERFIDGRCVNVETCENERCLGSRVEK